MRMALERSSISQQQLGDETITILREIYRLLDSLDGVGSDGPAVSGFRDAIDILFGPDAMTEVFRDATQDDEAGAESLQEILRGTADMEVTQPEVAALSLGEQNRRLTLYYSNRDEEESNHIVDKLFNRV